MKKKIGTLLWFVLLPMLTLNAQAGQDADYLRSAGKIYVVIAVIVVVFVGLVAFMIYLDRRLTKLENQIKDDV